jgi:hypothetical protein
VRAIDAAGNVDPTPARWSWTIDVTPPGTTITAKPAALVNETAASLAFTTDTGESFLCSLDGAAFAPCTSPAAYATLSEGAHAFEVKAVDAAGNVDPTPAAWSWTIDVTPPETTVTQGPAANQAVAEAILSFSTDTGVSFLCSLDGAAFAACTSPQPYAGLDEGPHAFAVKAVDAAGNVDPTPATWAWTIDLTTPETTLTQKPAAYERLATAAFAFTTDSGTSYRCRLDAAAFEACTTPVTFAALAEGEHAFEVFAVDDAGNADPTPARWRWTVDLTPPDTTLTEKPAAITNATGATLAFTTDTGAEFRCSLDGAPAAACTSPFAAAALAEGPHAFEVYAIDLAGNVDPTPARHEWVVDVTPPDTTITAKPAPAVAVADATFAFTTDTGTTFACSLDGGAYEPCVSPATYAGLAEGAHTFAVRATDAAGNTDPTPDSYPWNIDLTAPETTIEQGPPAQSASASGAFEFASTEPGTYECSLDGAAFAPCEESHTTAALEDGPHALEVRAIDLVGNVDPTPARHEWTVDTGLPDTTIATAPAAFSASAVATFTFAASEEATYECSVDGADFVSCDAESTFGPLGDGPHVLLVRAIDRAGNVDATPASHEWVVDTTAPETFVDAGPSTPWGSAQAPFTFSASEPVTYECSLDGAAFLPCDAATSFGPLADGPHELLVRATDRAGNVDPTPASWRWTSDTTPPDTTITAGPAAATRETSAAFAFASTEPGRYECILDGAAFAPCEAATALDALAEGAHTLAVRAIDETGNVDPTPATWAWTVDVTAPETTLTAKPAALANVATARLEFTSDDGVAYLCSVDGAAFAPCASPLDLTGLSEGRHTFAVKAVDAVGNEDATPATWAWEIDLTAPETRIATGPASPTFERSAAFTLESENGATYECSLDGAAFAPCDATVTLTALEPGEHVLEARAVDEAGNADPTPATWRWRIKPGTDRDGDGLNEEEEAALGTNPDDGDSDDDGVLDGDEPDAATDTDGDGLVNALDPDSDDDGLFDGTELGVTEASPWTDVSKKHFTADADPATRTDPLARDTDGGGLSDGAEDFNADGKLDASEGNVQAGEDDGALADTDGDGMPDAKEALLGSDPNDRDTDDDGVIDGREPNPGCDDDLDGLVDVLDPDSDGDFLWDGTEMAVTAPDADTDLTKGRYIADADPGTRTSPVVADTDRGGVLDGWEDFDADGKLDAGEFDPLVGADDAIDDDADKDGIVNAREAPGDQDGDGTPDALDTDSDGDGLPDSEESGLTSKTAPLRDTDGDGLPDFRDTDSDNDGISDALDNCPIVVNVGQEDADGAAPGDACTNDRDGDGVLDVADNCPDFANAEQTNTEGDGLGDACDAPLDEDKDGVIDGIGVTGGGCLNSSPGAVTWLGLAGLALLRRRRR